MPIFCQNCGNPDQTPETFCRICGEFQPDPGKPGKRRVTVNGFFLASGIFSLLCIVWCFALAAGHIQRYITSEESDFLTNGTIVMLIGMGFWNILNLYWAVTLLNRFAQYRLENKPVAEPKKVSVVAASELLNPARFDDNIPVSLVDDTTKTLDDKVRR